MASLIGCFYDSLLGAFSSPPNQEAYVPGFREGRLLHRVQPSIYSAKVSHAQLPDMLLRGGTQARRLIARIPLVQRREKHRSREGKSAFP